jgi:hypothetical protein
MRLGIPRDVRLFRRSERDNVIDHNQDGSMELKKRNSDARHGSSAGLAESKIQEYWPKTSTASAWGYSVRIEGRPLVEGQLAGRKTNPR